MTQMFDNMKAASDPGTWRDVFDQSRRALALSTGTGGPSDVLPSADGRCDLGQRNCLAPPSWCIR
jgi:hypothetical protein